MKAKKEKLNRKVESAHEKLFSLGLFNLPINYYDPSLFPPV